MFKRHCRKSKMFRLLWNLPLIAWTMPLSLAKVAIILLGLQTFTLSSQWRIMGQGTCISPTGCGSFS